MDRGAWQVQSMGSQRVRHTHEDSAQFLKYVHVVFIKVEHKRTPGVFRVSGIK